MESRLRCKCQHSPFATGVWAGLKRAVSSGGSNLAGQEVGEDFCWGSVAEDTAWSVVEFAGHEVEVGLVVVISVPVGTYSRSSRLVFSSVPRSHGE